MKTQDIYSDFVINKLIVALYLESLVRACFMYVIEIYLALPVVEVENPFTHLYQLDDFELENNNSKFIQYFQETIF